MNATTIAAVLAGLTSATMISTACNKTAADATEVPAEPKGDPVAAEHACGNHAEGACGAGDADATAATARTFEILPGKFAEANFQMTKGSKVSARFTKGSAEIAWDVHSHDHSGGTQIHDEGTSGEGTVELIAPDDGVFSILWQNTGNTATPLDVTITLGEGASIHSWMPAQ